MDTRLGVITKQETGFGKVALQSGDAETKTAGLTTMHTGRHLVLGRSHDVCGFAVNGHGLDTKKTSKSGGNARRQYPTGRRC
jgi:hypothetical protein